MFKNGCLLKQHSAQIARIKPKTNKKVTLERVELSDNLNKMMYACGDIKKIIPNLSLPVLYEMAKSYINLFLKSK